MKLSLFYGKKVVSTDGKCGYVLSVNANGGVLECLRCADEDENEFYIDIKNIVSVGDKIIYEDRARAIKASKPLRLGCAGYDERGVFLGNVTEKNYPAAGIECGDAVIVKNCVKLKSDVKKDGKVIIKKGEALSKETVNKAVEAGEFVQTTMKTIG